MVYDKLSEFSKSNKEQEVTALLYQSSPAVLEVLTKVKGWTIVFGSLG